VVRKILVMLMKEILGDMFRKGDIIVYNSIDRFVNFTKGKKYSVIESFLHDNICVTDDKSYPTWIKSTEFVLLKELRTQKLNKIL